MGKKKKLSRVSVWIVRNPGRKERSKLISFFIFVVFSFFFLFTFVWV